MIDWNLVQTALAAVTMVGMVLYGLTRWLKPPTALGITILWLAWAANGMVIHRFSITSMAIEIAPHLTEVLTVYVVAAFIAAVVLASGSLGLVLAALLAIVGRAAYIVSPDQMLLGVTYLGAYLPVLFAYEIYARREEASYDFKSELEKMRAMIEAEETKERQRR